MATIYANASGTILRFLRNRQEEIEFQGAPAGTASTLTFDESTNASVIAGLDTDWNSHTLLAGVLRRGAAIVNIAAASQEYTDRQAVLSTAATWLQGGTALTTAQLKQLLREVLRQLGFRVQ